MAATEIERFRRNAISGGVALATIAGLAWSLSRLLGQPLPFDIDLQGFMFLFLALVALSWFTRKSGEVAVGFVLLSAVLLLMLFAFLPTFLVDVFAAVVDPALAVIGLDTSLTTLIENSVGLFILTLTAVAVGIAASLRISGRAKKPPVIVDRTLKQLGQYAEAYADIGRLVAFFGVALFAVALNSAADFAGMVGDLVAQAPFVSGYLPIGLGGYLSLGGSLPFVGGLPIIGDLTAGEFAALVAIVVLAAAAVNRQTSGSLSQFVRRL